jgi:hypothetical protein
MLAKTLDWEEKKDYFSSLRVEVQPEPEPLGKGKGKKAPPTHKSPSIMLAKTLDWDNTTSLSLWSSSVDTTK